MSGIEEMLILSWVNKLDGTELIKDESVVKFISEMIELESLEDKILKLVI